jgi:RHS repeat-associated protein
MHPLARSFTYTEDDSVLNIRNRSAGLHYNYFRDHDPAVGRYVESDPIGLEGGSCTQMINLVA